MGKIGKWTTIESGNPIDLSTLETETVKVGSHTKFGGRYYIFVKQCEGGKVQVTLKKMNLFERFLRALFGYGRDSLESHIRKTLTDCHISFLRRETGQSRFEQKLERLASPFNSALPSSTEHNKPASREMSTKSSVEDAKQRDEGSVPQSIDSVIFRNLTCRSSYQQEEAVSFLEDHQSRYRAFSRSTHNNEKSHLIFLQGDIKDKHICDSKRIAAVVNAANKESSPFGGGVTGALGGISDTSKWIDRTKEARGGKEGDLEVGECVAIEAPFTKEIGVHYLFHSLGRSYNANASLQQISKDLQHVYHNLFAKARELKLDTIESPMISGDIFRPESIHRDVWERLNSSFFVAAANEWLQEEGGRAAILIDYSHVPGARL